MQLSELAKLSLSELAKLSLQGFAIQELVEVYRVDDDGRKSESIGFFKDPNIAQVFAGAQADANWHRVEKHFVLTDGNVGFLVGEPVTLLNDEAAALEAREKALAKLSPAERAILKV